MNLLRGRMPTGLALTLGIALGWVLANHRPPTVKAGGGDRHADDILTSGPIAIEYNSLTKTQAQKDALYFLDYRGGRLLATVPTQRESMGGAKVIDALEDCFELQRGDLVHARQTLRDHGNMSSVTVLFVLRAALDAKQGGRRLLTTLGPGFTAAMMVIDG